MIPINDVSDTIARKFCHLCNVGKMREAVRLRHNIGVQIE